MHISEGFLPPVHAIGWTVASAPFVVQGFRAVKKHLDERPEDKVRVASAGAFAFVLSAMKIPSVTGSSSHPTGVGLGTVLFKPKVMTLHRAAVPRAAAGPWRAHHTRGQHLFHGGLRALGLVVHPSDAVSDGTLAVGFRARPEKAVRTRSSWILLAGLVLMIAAPLAAHSGSLFTGSDNRGTEAISKVDPGYKRWFSSTWTPSGSVGSFLFAMQAALGAGLVGYVVGSRRQSKPNSVKTTSVSAAGTRPSGCRRTRTIRHSGARA